MTSTLGIRLVSVAVFALFMALANDVASAETAPSGPFLLAAVHTDSPPPLIPSIDAPQWRLANPVSLNWDFTFHRPALESTTAYMLFDDKFVYIAAVAKQKSPVIATQHTNDVGDDLDDNVAVQFWPSGATGIRYKFTATSIGTRYQESSENETYAPQWDAVGHAASDGFTIVMRIPLNVMRGDGRTQWRVQFQRLKRATGELYMWATDPGATEDDQGQFAGYLNGMVGLGGSTRTRARLALYELATAASQAVGGSTSRIGADLAVPVTPTSSLLTTAHPDFSNVELDQQAIQPLEFKRVLQEVRPFFVQGANYYNKFDQIGNTNNIMLNTPSIQSPRVGTALEGQQGGADFGLFNSVGSGNTDSADALTWTTSNKRFLAGYQRVACTGLTCPTAQFAGTSDFYDLAQAGTMRYDNLRNFFVYGAYGTDRGTNVTDPAAGNWREAGVSLYSPTARVGIALKKIGALYSPVDGIVDHPDIAGYATEARRVFDFSSASYLRSILLTGDLERYHDATGALDQADQTAELTVAARNLFTFGASTGSHFLSIPNTDPTLPPTGDYFNNNQLSLGYNLDSSAPVSIAYGFGLFGGGYLHTWNRFVGFRAGPRITLDFESDETRFDASVQALQRIGFTEQLGPDDSVSIGVRRVTGETPSIGVGNQAVAGTNLSFAFHHRAKGYEIYSVYGDPNAPLTYPVLTVKLIEYFGAQKGT